MTRAFAWGVCLWLGFPTPACTALPVDRPVDTRRADDPHLSQERLKILAALDGPAFNAHLAGLGGSVERTALIKDLLRSALNDDLVLKILVERAGARAEHALAAVEPLNLELVRVFWLRSARIASKLGDDELDELYLTTTADDARNSCRYNLDIGRMSPIAVIPGRLSDRAVELIARGWKAAALPGPVPFADQEELVRAAAAFEAALGTARLESYSQAADNLVDPDLEDRRHEDAVAIYCAEAGSLRELAAGLPKSQRVAWLRENLAALALLDATPAERSPPVKAFTPGEVSLEFPPEADVALRNAETFSGRQIVRIRIDRDGQPIGVEIVSSEFSPEQGVDAEGNAVVISKLFERRVTQFFMAGRFQLSDASKIVTIYEIPITWTRK